MRTQTRAQTGIKGVHDADTSGPSFCCTAAGDACVSATIPLKGASESLQEYGLIVREPAGLAGTLRFERPGWVFGHRLKNCTIGAFTFFNSAGKTSVYRTQLGRYSQIGESSVIGPPEHPMDWFSSHPFAFTRPEEVPEMYRLDDFARLAPKSSSSPSWASQQVNRTVIGHEAYIGAGTFIKRGVTIGDGAVVGAGSVVTRDVPPFSMAVGSPAKVIRQRFSDPIVERLMALQWWNYDLAPWRDRLDFSQVEATLECLEDALACGTLHPLVPDSFALSVQPGGFDLQPLDQPLFPSQTVTHAHCG